MLLHEWLRQQSHLPAATCNVCGVRPLRGVPHLQVHVTGGGVARRQGRGRLLYHVRKGADALWLWSAMTLRGVAKGCETEMLNAWCLPE